jgi:hypothetical protein
MTLLKKTIKYTDFNGEEMEEDFFFHLSKAELVELELSEKDGLSEALKKIVAAEDGKEIIRVFKTVLLGAYGKKSEDGRRFIKNQQLRDEFESSEAYSELFMEMLTNTDSAIDFINGIVPAGLAEEATKVIDTDRRALASVPEEPKPEPVLVTRAELIAMNTDELQEFNRKLAAGEVTIAE